MNRIALFCLALLVACDSSPSHHRDLIGPELRSASATRVILLVPPQTVEMELANGGRRTSDVTGQLMLSGGEAVAQMDGAILVVSAADGPMPQLPHGLWGQALLRLGSVHQDKSGVIRFSGVATLLYADGVRRSFEVVGTAQPVAECGPGCAELEFAIHGGEAWADAAGPSHWTLTITSRWD